jgi:lipocalin-like protein
MRQLLLTASLLVLAVVSNPRAQAQDAPAKRLVGAWRLVSVEGTSPVFKFVFDHPHGLIIYDPSGVVSVQQANIGDRKPFAKGPAAGTLEEKAESFDSYGAYYGTYTVDASAGTVTHHIEDGSNPALRGRENVRWYEFQGNDRVVLIPTEDGKGGTIARKDATYKLTWERIKK